jgi:hypothetical protein
MRQVWCKKKQKLQWLPKTELDYLCWTLKISKRRSQIEGSTEQNFNIQIKKNAQNLINLFINPALFCNDKNYCTFYLWVHIMRLEINHTYHTNKWQKTGPFCIEAWTKFYVTWSNLLKVNILVFLHRLPKAQIFIVNARESKGKCIILVYYSEIRKQMHSQRLVIKSCKRNFWHNLHCLDYLNTTCTDHFTKKTKIFLANRIG